jgi:hypothetical protein
MLREMVRELRGHHAHQGRGPGVPVAGDAGIGAFATINELAAAEKINSSYVSRMLRLTLLAPKMVGAILDGQQPAGVTLPGLMEPFPDEWIQQAACPLP